MKLHHRLLLALAPFFALPNAAFSQTSAVPSLISYQGTVYQADGITPVGQGTPVNRSVVFRIWSHQSNSALADLIYSETQVVTIADGQFSVLVGEGVATTVGNYGNETTKKLTDLSTAFSSGDCYLGVTVAAGAALLATDNEISPRQRIVSTGFALRAKLAESLAGGNDFILNPTTVPAGSLASNYGVGWYGTGRLFGTTAVDGPVLFGNSGGALGSSNGSGGTKSLSLLWNNAGQVGIGATGNFAGTNKLTLQGDDATSPASQLSIRGNSDNNKRVLLGYNTIANNATLQSYAAASTAGNLLLNPAGGNVGIGTTAAPTQALDVTGNGRFTGTVTATGFSGSGAGLTGIPTLAASNTFTVQQSIASAANSGPNLIFRNTRAEGGTLVVGLDPGVYYSGSQKAPNDSVVTTYGSGKLHLTTTYELAGGITIDVQGNVGIGKRAPTSKFHMNLAGNSTDWDIRLDSEGWQGALRMSPDNYLDMTNRAGAGGAIEGTGFARLNSTGSWTVVSDGRLKCDIEPLQGMLDKAMALRPVNFHFKSDPSGEKQVGFVAQEVEELFPSLVTNGEILTMDYAGMSTVAIGAIKEQQAIIAALQKKIEALEKESSALTTRLDQIPDGLLARLEALEATEKAKGNKLNAMKNAENPAAEAVSQTVSLKNEASTR